MEFEPVIGLEVHAQLHAARVGEPPAHINIRPARRERQNIVKHAAALTKAELNYRSSLNWLTYSCLLDFAKYLKDELNGMKMNPRDMIDVQSFMWCITPGKYD